MGISSAVSGLSPVNSVTNVSNLKLPASIALCMSSGKLCLKKI
jgi:hypothetical protein